jgi:arsenate reductase
MPGCHQPEKIIFACVHNAGRSQMAAAWFNALADPSQAVAVSAGTAPAEQIHPEVVSVMREAGVELANARPKRLTAEIAADALLLVTMGCGEACPYIPGLRVIDWPIEDPKGKPAEQVRHVRDDIRSRVESLMTNEGFKKGGGVVA